MKDESGRKKFRGLFWPLIALIFLLYISVPWVLIAALQHWNLKPAAGPDSAAWLGFWGACTGNAWSAAAVLMAFAVLYRQNAKQEKAVREQYRQIRAQMEAMERRIPEAQPLDKEQRRLQMLPFVNVRKEAESDPDADFKCIALDCDGCVIEEEPVVGSVLAATFSNIGAGPAIGLELSGEHLGHLAAGESLTVLLNLPLVNYFGTLCFPLRFADRETRKYRQEVRLRHGDETYEISIVTPPEPDE